MDILELVRKYVRSKKIKTQFENEISDEDWFWLFRKRHRVSLKIPKGLERYKLQDKPRQIDETSFTLDPSKTEIVG